MSMMRPPAFSVAETAGKRVTLRSAEGHVAHIFVLENDIIRVMVLPGGTVRSPRSWAVAPGGEDVPSEGRDKFDLTGFACPEFELRQEGDRLLIETPRLLLSVRLAGLFCRWETRIGGSWRPAVADRPTQAYNFGWWDQRAYHYLARARDEMYFGLGERAGDANRAGQSYRMTNVDPMGYNARTTDPLYKHIPFYITWRAETKTPLGLFYDTVSDCTFDMGRELDNYHGHYRYFVADFGDLDYYVVGGDSIADITRRFTWMTGRPAFMPRWSLAYSGSTMSYTDAPDAQVRMNEFLALCAEHDIPCESFHLSSGYTSIGPNRYVFNWNREKFPDPRAFAQRWLDHGVRFCANIKPCLLRDHPRFEECAREGLFIHDPDGSPNMVQFWDEVGAYLDFTNEKTRAWWRTNVKEALLDYGIASTWNDNNEFEVWSERALVDGFGKPAPARESKVLHTLLMLQASRRAQREHTPDLRPFMISRAGFAGMQRYVQTWSGDNYTSWETLRYNVRMGTGLAVSGISNTGHDIGGFSGPKPEPELFLRWVQFGIFLPRFSIHSWNDDGTANEPWMYPELTAHVRGLIKFRQRLIPYFYHLLWRYHDRYEPMIRPTYHDFPGDPRCFEENDDMLLGAHLLVPAVVEPGVAARRVYLPEGADWYDFWSGTLFTGGREVVLPAPADRPPLLARAGSVIPLNVAEQHFNRPADERGFAVFPLPGEGSFTQDCFEDDGESEGYRTGQHGAWRLRVESDPATVRVGIERTGVVPPGAVRLTLFVPSTEVRRLELVGATLISEGEEAGQRRVAVAV